MSQCNDTGILKYISRQLHVNARIVVEKLDLRQVFRQHLWQISFNYHSINAPYLHSYTTYATYIVHNSHRVDI
jgi:hypothetical protein